MLSINEKKNDFRSLILNEMILNLVFRELTHRCVAVEVVHLTLLFSEFRFRLVTKIVVTLSHAEEGKKQIKLVFEYFKIIFLFGLFFSRETLLIFFGFCHLLNVI
jgi:hypothetical protein